MVIKPWIYTGIQPGKAMHTPWLRFVVDAFSATFPIGISPVQPSPKPPHNNNNNNTIIDYVKASIHLFNDSRNSTTTTTRATMTRPKKESSAAVEGGNDRFSSNANRSTLSEMKRSDLPPRNKYIIAFSWSISVDGWMGGWR